MIETVLPYLKRQLGLQEIYVEDVENGLATSEKLGPAEALAKGYDKTLIEQAEPGDPQSELQMLCH